MDFLMYQKHGWVNDLETWSGWWFKTGLVDEYGLLDDSETCSEWLLVLMIQEWMFDDSETWISFDDSLEWIAWS